MGLLLCPFACNGHQRLPIEVGSEGSTTLLLVEALSWSVTDARASAQVICRTFLLKFNLDDHVSWTSPCYWIFPKASKVSGAYLILFYFHHLHIGWGAVPRGIFGPGIRETVVLLVLGGDVLVLVVLAVLFRAAETTVVRMVLAVADDGLWGLRGWGVTWVSLLGASRFDTRKRDPLTKACCVLPDCFSGKDLTDILRVIEAFPAICDSLAALSCVLLLHLSSDWAAAARVTAEERSAVLRGLASRLGEFADVWIPCEASFLERVLRIPVLLEGPLLPPIPLRAGLFTDRTSSLDVGDPGLIPSLRSPSLSFLHLEQRLGAGRGSGEVGGDKVS